MKTNQKIAIVGQTTVTMLGRRCALCGGKLRGTALSVTVDGERFLNGYEAVIHTSCGDPLRPLAPASPRIQAIQSNAPAAAELTIYVPRTGYVVGDTIQHRGANYTVTRVATFPITADSPSVYGEEFLGSEGGRGSKLNVVPSTAPVKSEPTLTDEELARIESFDAQSAAEF